MILDLWPRISNAVKNGTNLDCKLTYPGVVTDLTTLVFSWSKPVDALSCKPVVARAQRIGAHPKAETNYPASIPARLLPEL
jgi:hypothetical protein